MHQVWPGASDALFYISWFSIPPETLVVRYASPCPAGMFISKVPWVFVLVCLLVWDSIHLGRDLCRFSYYYWRRGCMPPQTANPWRSEDKLWDSVLSFLCVDPGISPGRQSWQQVPHPLSHLVGPNFLFSVSFLLPPVVWWLFPFLR